jgi:hypothetical protein
LAKNPHFTNDAASMSARTESAVAHQAVNAQSLCRRCAILADAEHPQVDEQPLGNSMTLIIG